MMDSALGTAARALALGDTLTALKLVALRRDPSALALRGVAMAQLGELATARRLLKRAGRGFGDAEPIARARAAVAEAEVALAQRDLSAPTRALDDARRVLARAGDAANATFAQLIAVRRLVFLGQSEAAALLLQELSLAQAPARLVALSALIEAELAMRRVDGEGARISLTKARAEAARAMIPALVREVERTEQLLASPVARLRRGAELRPVRLSELPALFGSGELVVDACRRCAQLRGHSASLLARPLLLELLVALAELSPSGVRRETLISRAFGTRRSNESYRVRLRVEIGRLRKLLAGLAEVAATPEGFALIPEGNVGVASLLPLNDGEASALLSLLRSGHAWSTSALSKAIGKSQRAVQRALADLVAEGKVRSVGRGPAKRWTLPPVAETATTLLLIAPGTLS